jgi:hypothetical protein
MSASSKVASVATWLFAGATYSIHRGLGGAIRGWMVISAVGPHRAYRSMILAASAANDILSDVLSTNDPAARAEQVESLLHLCGASTSV